MIIVPGPVALYAGGAECNVAGGAQGSVSLADMVRLGQTENGVQVSISNRAHRVNVDDMGGSQGAPAELIYLGSSASIRGVIVDYGEPNAAAVGNGVKQALWGIARGLRFIDNDGNKGDEDGEIAAPGTPLFEYGYGFSLLLVGSSLSYYFPRCELATAPREWNVSSLERKTSFTANAYEVPVVSNNSYDGRCLYMLNPTLTGNVSSSYTSCRTTTHSDVSA